MSTLSPLVNSEVTKETNTYENWLHVDMKGMMPSENRFYEWLNWISKLGYSTLVLEYEDRIPWESWPETYRAGFDRPTWERIRHHCSQLGIQVIPLVQTFGHLEWLAKHDRWSHLRCNGNANLICPQHPEIRSLLAAWLEEVVAMHPESPYIHVGLDEVYHLGECPHCQRRAAELGQGKLGVLLEHASYICETVIALGKRPIIWADMFLHHGEEGIELSQQLPLEVVLCDWNYQGDVGTQTKALIGNANREVLVASAIRRSYWTYFLVDKLSNRHENILQWHRKARNGQLGPIKAIIHTVWTRSRGLAPLYGPWEGWLTGFYLGINPDNPLSEAMQKGVELVEKGLKSCDYNQIQQFVKELENLESDEPMEKAALEWWILSLQHRAEIIIVEYALLSHEGLRSSVTYMGTDPDLINEANWERDAIRTRLEKIQTDMEEYLRRYEWSDTEEYLSSRIQNIFRALSYTPPIEAEIPVTTGV
jgi:hypothetical protein